MPTFFQESELTAEQKARWDGAIVEYAKVQESNVERKFANLSEAGRAFYIKEGATTDDEIKVRMRAFVNLMGNSPGDPKSALFARLLNGKAALPFPPPTSYSYPWYSVVEDTGVHRASLRGVMTAGSHLNGTNGAKGKFGIGINQCMWAVKSHNSAAQLLLDLNVELQKVAKKKDPKDDYASVYEWTDDLLERVKATYASGPEFIVQYGDWPEFRLFVTQLEGPDDCHSIRKYAKEKILGGVQFLKRVGSVFDLDALDLNARIGKTLNHGVHPKVRLESAKARYAALLASNNAENILPFLVQFDKEAAEKTLESLENDVREFEAHPDNNDWVELFLDTWCLEKVNAANAVAL